MASIDFKKKFRVEKSLYCSGIILNENKIPVLKENLYYIKDIQLDGDAPKQFIKAYFYEEDSGIRKKNPKSWFSYIAKSAEKWYPHESVIEFLLNRIGQELGLCLNEVKLIKVNGQIRFLSKYFRNKNEILIHGAEICGEYLHDMDMAKEIAKNKNTARELFTFEFIENAIASVFPNAWQKVLEDLVKMLTFDALVGANDRHFYNWGVIENKKLTNKNPKFAPIYDTARGLLWNFSDDNIVEHYKNLKTGGKKIENYIRKASPRISFEKKQDANHFDIIKFLKKRHGDYKKIINDLSSRNNEEKVINMIQKEFSRYIIPERTELITYIIRERFNKVSEL